MADHIHTWIEVWMEVAYATVPVGAVDDVFVVLAYDMDHAFLQARQRHPTARIWRCAGRVDPRNAERRKPFLKSQPFKRAELRLMTHVLGDDS